jgi:hypothetical protein
MGAVLTQRDRWLTTWQTGLAALVMVLAFSMIPTGASRGIAGASWG